ncbi:rod shape-determining protein MreC [candidate division KSB1 bacterium]
MDRLYQFVWKNGHHLALFICCLISVVFLLQGQNNRVVLAKKLSSRLLLPLQSGIRYFRSITELKEENHKLGDLVMQLSRENQELVESGLENERLRAMINFKEKTPFRAVMAEVVSVAGGRLQNSITIDRGIDSGLRPPMPVVHAAGLVGRIVEVFDNSATVQLLLDRDSRVSALVQRSRTLGILQWKVGKLLELQKVHLRADVRQGDLVVTSGFGGVFPKGVVIGEVTQVNEDEYNLTKEVLVVPAVDFDHLEEVFVVLSSSPNEIDEYRLSADKEELLAQILGSTYSASKEVAVERARRRIISDSTRADSSRTR